MQPIPSARALAILDLNVLVPTGWVRVKVERGWLTLTGEVDWADQRGVWSAPGVRSVEDHVRVV
ncbi:MAG: BON domain-containing protein [Caulobacteraceae bacterium]